MPQSLGKISIAAGGTPVRLTTNQGTPANPKPCQSLMVQALPGNSGVVYVFESPAAFADDRTNLTRCVGIIPKPASATTGPFGSVTLGKSGGIPFGGDASKIWIDGTTSDGVIGVIE